MVDCLGKGTFRVIPPAVTEMLRRGGDVKGTMDVLVLVNQTISRFKEESLEVVEGVYDVVVSTVLDIIQRHKGLLRSDMSSQASQVRNRLFPVV